MRSIERGSKNTLLVVVDQRDEETLAVLIKQSILPGIHVQTHIITDRSSSCKNSQEL